MGRYIAAVGRGNAQHINGSKRNMPQKHETPAVPRRGANGAAALAEVNSCRQNVVHRAIAGLVKKIFSGRRTVPMLAKFHGFAP